MDGDEVDDIEMKHVYDDINFDKDTSQKGAYSSQTPDRSKAAFTVNGSEPQTGCALCRPLRRSSEGWRKTLRCIGD